MTRAKTFAEGGLKSWARRARVAEVAYGTQLGVSLVGDSLDVLERASADSLKGRVQLVFTSPPFPLNRKKKYGNREGEAFKKWLAGYALALRSLLSPEGSIVIEMGNAWEPGKPVMSTLALESLLAFKEAADLFLCQEFVWYNPARLPTPAQWVTIQRVRVKDAFTRLWWLSPTTSPKADNRRVLTPYSMSMRDLLKRRKYNAGRRPSEHSIGQKSFFSDNGGAIPANVLSFSSDQENLPENVLAGSNTSSSDDYQRFCKRFGIPMHPARMPINLAKFFIEMCTDLGDIVFDPFAGSNTTGAAAEQLKRKWVSIEADEGYAISGVGRFPRLAQRHRSRRK
jgi:site-specific DNA-methyltransferase (cytosine-N4-specific)